MAKLEKSFVLKKAKGKIMFAAQVEQNISLISMEIGQGRGI